MDSMDVNEITKVIDGVYKNITDNFNPASKQMIATGKAYLKSLHGASAACSMYLDALVKLSKQAQQSSVGTSVDIGTSMMQIADVFKDIHTQQLTTLKAFYVDFLVPLETNLEKDVKVIQNEQKKFLVSHKHRVESYNKAVSNAKKVRKKSKKSSTPSSNTLDKEIRIMQTMEEERSKLEAFCEEALRESLTQERRRYGFVLERQASLAKHYLSLYSKGSSVLGPKLDAWLNVAKNREALPESLRTNLVKKIQGDEECIYCSPRRPADDAASITSQLRKTKSMEASEMLNIQVSRAADTTASTSASTYHQNNSHQHQHQHQLELPVAPVASLSRAKSDTSLGTNNYNPGNGGIYGTTTTALMNTHNSVANTSYNHNHGATPENFRAQKVHQAIVNTTNMDLGHLGYAKAVYAFMSNGDNQLSFMEGDMIALIGELSRGWQFGENLRTQKMGWFPVAYTEFDQKPVPHLEMVAQLSPIPPPLPPPIPATTHQRVPTENPGCKDMAKSNCVKSNLMIPSNRTNDSLHSSNDSGFSNEGAQVPVPPPPQPEVDYSDEEPQLSNSEENPGTGWLMDRYHMSESARMSMNSSTRRRSLSSGNLSTTYEQDIRGNNLRNASFHNGAGSSPRGAHHLATAYYDENGKDEKDGPLKKFLNRTKSLIWRRPSNATDQYQHGNASHHRPQQALECISIADTASELWGSHSSIVETTDFETKGYPGGTRGRNLDDDICNDRSREVSVNDSKRKQISTQMEATHTRRLVHNDQSVPSLPPRNNVEQCPPQHENQGARKTNKHKMQNSPGSSSAYTASTSTSNRSVPFKEADSCMVVKDHSRPKKSEYDTYRVSDRKSNDNHANVNKSQNQTRRTKPNVVQNPAKSSDRMTRSTKAPKAVTRMESFAVSEAPIIPENSRHNGKQQFSRSNVAAAGSVPNSVRISRSRVATSNFCERDSNSVNSGQAKSTEESNLRGRRRLWDNGVNNINEDDSNSEVNEIEEDEDEGTIDFNDNDDQYDDEASSSVFVEADCAGSLNKSAPSHHGMTLSQEYGSVSSGTNRCSKSADTRQSNASTRRTRSTSARSSTGTDTVDLPKRHGGFVREKSNGPPNPCHEANERSHQTPSSQTKNANVEASSQKPKAAKESRRGQSTGRSNGSNMAVSPVSDVTITNAKQNQSKGLTYKGRPIGSPPPIPPPPLPPVNQQALMSHHTSNALVVRKIPDLVTNEGTEMEPDYGTIKGSPPPQRKELVKMVSRGKHQSLIIRDDARSKNMRGPWKRSIRSEVHTMELITADVAGGKPVVDYGSYIHRRLYYPERGSKLDQKSEHSGNYCGPWYDLWGEDKSVNVD